MINKKPIGLCAADGKPIRTHRYVILWVRSGDYDTKDEFLVCDNLPNTMSLEAKFIDKNVAAVHVAEIQLSGKTRHAFPWFARKNLPGF